MDERRSLQADDGSRGNVLSTEGRFHDAVTRLGHAKNPILINESFWTDFWSDVNSTEDVFTLFTPENVRLAKEACPANLAIITQQSIDVILHCVEHGVSDVSKRTHLLNALRLLLRLVPFIFENDGGINFAEKFFWLNYPASFFTTSDVYRADTDTVASFQGKPGDRALAIVLLDALMDLCFLDNFTVSLSSLNGDDKNAAHKKQPESLELIWEAGVGMMNSLPSTADIDHARTEVLHLLLACLSITLYDKPTDLSPSRNRWLSYFVSSANRHSLAFFCSLLNIVCAYDPVGLGVPYNHVVFADCREALVEVSLHVLIVALDLKYDLRSDTTVANAADVHKRSPSTSFNYTATHLTRNLSPDVCQTNLFANYVIRLHLPEDLEFILSGFSRLLNNPLQQTYLPNSLKRITCYQELLILFWNFADLNKSFLHFVLKSSDVLDIIVPILYFLDESKKDQSLLGVVHIGVFIMLLFSSERNFGVRLNKAFTMKAKMDLPLFKGNYADFLIIVFHKLITMGHERLASLYDCLLTIMVNVSPYLKSMCIVSASKLLHLFDMFSSPTFLLAAPSNHHLVFFILEMMNNIIQYQFDGNVHLVYSIIRRRHAFDKFSSLPNDLVNLQRCAEGKPLILDLEKTNTSIFSISSSMDELALPTAYASSSVDQISSNGNGKMPFTVGTQGMPYVELNSTIMPDTESLTVSMRDIRNKPIQFNVTQDWVNSWKPKLPLQTIMRLLQVLVPQVETICLNHGISNESDVLEFLRHGTLVGLLPVPHPILIRKYQPNDGTNVWFTTYLWGVVYLRTLNPPIWVGTNVSLFRVKNNH